MLMSRSLRLVLQPSHAASCHKGGLMVLMDDGIKGGVEINAVGKLQWSVSEVEQDKALSTQKSGQQ